MLLQGAIGLIGAAPARGLAEPARADQGAGAPPAGRPLTEAEVDDLVAFGEILVDGGPLGPAERRHLAEHIAYRTAREAAFAALYRDTLRELEQLAGARFSTLGARARADLVARHRLAAPDPPLARRARARVVRDLIAGYYGSAAGWAAVGYATFPGRCGDLARYTRPEA